jgi:hypothetical protein
LSWPVLKMVSDLVLDGGRIGQLQELPQLVQEDTEVIQAFSLDFLQGIQRAISLFGGEARQMRQAQEWSQRVFHEASVATVQGPVPNR